MIIALIRRGWSKYIFDINRVTSVFQLCYNFKLVIWLIDWAQIDTIFKNELNYIDDTMYIKNDPFRESGRLVLYESNSLKRQK